MANPIGARRCDSFQAVSTAPSINKTPVGNSTPPLPYPTIADLSNSVDIVPSVRFNGKPVYVLAQTTQPTCKGDDAGVCNGVKSGTVNGEVKPVAGSTTVRAGGKFVVRQGDPCTMNGGNNPGIYITTQAPSGGVQNGALTGNTDPPIQAETPAEKGWLARWWEKTKHEVGEAVDHPWEATKGVAKGIANIPSELGEMMMKGSALQSAGEMEQAAAMQAAMGQAQSAQTLSDAAQEVRAGAGDIELPKFKMSNAAQAGGDKIVTGVTLLAGGAGLVKSGIRGVSALSKGAVAAEAEGAKTISEGSKLLGGEKAIAEGAKAADTAADTAKAADTVKTAEAVETPIAKAEPAGNGVKIVERIKSLREKYLGRTPGKKSKTGKEVQERMRKEGTLREGRKGTEFKGSDGEWYPLKEADMAHKTDAVKWWNETGRQYGAKAKEVRDWMLDSKNYTLDHYSINRSLGAKIGETYLPPLK